MKQQFLDLTGLTELVAYIKSNVTDKKEILPYASNKLFPSTGDINAIYIDTATNTIYRWDTSSKTYIILAKAVKSVSISESTENGKITLTVDGVKTTVPIHGLGSAAYTNSNAYSPADHTHTKAQIGLGSVDNTADKDKSVKHANTADSATTAGTATAATNVSAEIGQADIARHVWFSDNYTETKRNYNDNFKYNPTTNTVTANISGSAASANSVLWSGVTNKPSTFTPSSHNHDDSTITSLNASKLFGIIDIARLPHGALERLVIVEDDTARFKLTTANVQLGDTVKVIKTEKMYYVVDESKLSSEAGYSVYTAGTATSVPWSGVTGKPSSYPPASHNHDERYYTETEMNSKLAEKAPKVHTHVKSEVGLGNVDNTSDANKSVKYAASAGTATKANAVPWSGVTGKPSTYPPSSHTHNYAGSSTAGGNAYNANALYKNPSTRQTSANYDLTNDNIYAHRVTYSVASSTMTTAKPPTDAHILTFGWDTNAGYGAQFAVGNSFSNHLYIRGAKSETKDNKNVCTWESSWRTVLDSENYTSYTVTKTGGGASGTWGISVTGNAATATKLTTARSINGTNFDGSSNITTATWGTARNITIGSTKKSVNGGADVSWSLSEIGAAAASHSHSYLPLSGGTMTGALHIMQPGSGSYNENIRIHPSTAGWASIVMCGTDNTGNSGTSEKTWGLYTSEGQFAIAKNGNGLTSGTAILKCDNNNSWTINGSTILDSVYIKQLIAGKSIDGCTSSQFIIIPKVHYDVIDSTHTTETYLGGLIKWVCKKYPNRQGCTFIGQAVPNATGNVSIYIYDTSDLQNGYPRYAVGFFYNLGGTISSFGTNEYGPYYREGLMNDNNYAGSASPGGAATSANKLNTNAGSSTQPIYFNGGKPVACSYTINTSVPSGAKFTDTNTWRPLGTTGDTACAGNDSRLSNARPASDVYAWAKASSKPSYSWGEITGKPSTFAPASHTHNYAGSSSAGGNANAAVKLATARTINGTSFNGSANITTANWGTARTITVGNTGKSVNGSGNVSWSLGEIGVHVSNKQPTASDGKNGDVWIVYEG